MFLCLDYIHIHSDRNKNERGEKDRDRERFILRSWINCRAGNFLQVANSGKSLYFIFYFKIYKAPSRKPRQDFYIAILRRFLL